MHNEFSIFCNNTLTPSLFSRCCEAERAQLSDNGGGGHERVGVRSLKYNGITWDNRKLFYISYQQGFQRLSLSHCVLLRQWDNQTKSSTNKFKTILYIYIMKFQYFCNNTLSYGSLSRFSSGRAGLMPLGFKRITWDNRKLFYIIHQQGFHRFPISHRVSLVECDSQTKRLFPEAAFFQGRRKTPGIRY